MSRLLLIETSSRLCSVAVAEGGCIVAEREELSIQGYRHAEALHPMIGEVLASAGLKVRDLTGIAAGQGPGSYTGLRIGLSAAKGLALPWGIPCYGVSSLEMLAEAVKEKLKQLLKEDQALCIWTAMDARRMEVYEAFFDASGMRISQDRPQIIDASWADRSAAWAGGDGVEKSMEHWPSLRDSGVRFASARHALAAASRCIQAGDSEDLAAWEPQYLKAFGQVL
jgi:tRNA threonylcarbamoyladenosine biosynthesis protein TsaB